MYATLVQWYGKRTVWLVTTVIVLAVAALLVQPGVDNIASETATSTADLPLVAVAAVDTLRGDTSVTLIGTVASIDRAILESETGGRVTRVPVTLGQTVGAGAIIATLENASERAAVLQAEGAYEAVVAQAAQSDVSVFEAQNNVAVAENNLRSTRNNAIGTARSAYTTANSIVRNQMDQFFSNPNGPGVIGLRIDGEGNTAELVAARRALREELPLWQAESANLTVSDDLTTALQSATTRTTGILTMVDQFITALSTADPTPRFDAATLATVSNNFSTARSQLTASLTQLEQAQTDIENAEQSVENANRALERAELGGTGTTVSAADAQVKQALGSLRAAEANLEKTIIRSPINGTINQLDVQVGDFLATRDQVAIVANNDALEITTFVSESDRQLLSVGDTVTIEDDLKGTVTTIAPATDELTGKREVKIQTTAPSLETGDTVDLTITNESGSSETTSGPLLLPITAIRFTAEDGYVLTVDGDTLVRNDVTLGRVRGNQVEVLSGVAPDMRIVVDARGLAAGQAVDIATN